MEDNVMTLLKKGEKGLKSIIFSRMIIIIILFIIHLLLLLSVFNWFSNLLPHIFGTTVVFTVIMVIYLINSNMNSSAKITWLILILVLPVFGSLFYFYTISEIGSRTIKKRLSDILDTTRNRLKKDEKTLSDLNKADPNAASLAHYVNTTGCYPVYSHTDVTYFPLGENKFETLIEKLKEAKEFIFLEYFIIEEGEMWGRILNILSAKVKEGVEVRVMYDGTCELSTLPHNYPEKLKELGIKCKVFAPLTPFVSTYYNYRDHRKILVIDNKYAFNGGVNLADEYINVKEKHGHWKDTAIMLEGEAVSSFTLMFLQMWNIDEKNMEFDKYLNKTY
ncbi:MAG: phospholipase D-like domain-containing protein, partial [Erysipelotrichaceae bacterium]